MARGRNIYTKGLEGLILKICKQKASRKERDTSIADAIKKAYPKEFNNYKRDTLRRKIGEIRLEYKLKDELEIKEKEVDFSVEGHLQEHQVRKNTKDYKKQVELLTKEVEVKNELLGLKRALENVTKIDPIKVNKKLDGKTEGVVLTVLSDIHIEHKINPKTINGLNEYNLDIAKTRLNTYFLKVVQITNILRGDLRIDNLCLALLGDTIHGHIHDEYKMTNMISPIEASIYAYERYKAGIDFLLLHGKFKHIDVVCHVGNHSRITEKIYSDAEAKMSHEWGIFQHLKRTYEGNDVIKFWISESYFSYQSIFGKEIRFHHGHGFKYAGGVGGIYMPMIRYILKCNQQFPADLDVMGHWHQYSNPPEALVNGSVCGFDPYALRKGFKPEPPMQQYQIIDNKKGRGFTWNCKLHLE